MKTMNNNQNHNSRPTTFVEELGSVIRRNSTIPQFIGGDFTIVNGDVEARAIVSCSNAAYRTSISEPTLPRPYFTPNLGYVYVPECKGGLNEDHEKTPAECKDCTGCCLPVDDDHSEPKDQPTIDKAPVQHDDTIITAKQELENLEEKHAESSFSEKLADDYYNKSSRLKTKISNAEDEDLLVNILTGLQLTRKFKELNYSIRSDFSFIDERQVSKRLDFILTSFGIDTQLAQDVYNRIHDCLGFDVFTIKAKNNNVYIICGNVDGVVETFCSATASETSMQFITRMMEANKP